MGDDTISPSEASMRSEAQALAELEAEFQRELDRNQAALQLLVARAEETKIAKSRSELSAKKMECMKIKYSVMHNKLETTRQTLTNAQDRLDRHTQIESIVEELREKAESIAQKTNFEDKNLLLAGCGPDFDFPQPLINYDEEEEKDKQEKPSTEPQENSLPVNSQASANENIEVSQKQADSRSSSQMQTSETEVFSPPGFHDISGKAGNGSGKIDYAQTVLNLQEKLSRINVSSNVSSASSNASSVVSSSAIRKVEDPSTADEDHENLEDELAIDLNESVQRLEAKCAGVREELGRMALSEQYMRTKQAQLRARKKEMEAKQALIKADIKEREAAIMRRKVEEMMKLLAARKNKLSTSENLIEKKDQYVQGVQKILQRKERRVYYCEKQKQLDAVYGGKKKEK